MVKYRKELIMKEKVILQFERERTGECFDIEVPLTITANELLYSLNRGLQLGLNLADVSQCYLTTENPIALLKGDISLEEFGIHDGTKICFNR